MDHSEIADTASNALQNVEVFDIERVHVEPIYRVLLEMVRYC